MRPLFSTNPSCYQVTEWLIDWPTDRLTDWMTDRATWSAKWLTDWLTNNWLTGISCPLTHISWCSSMFLSISLSQSLSIYNLSIYLSIYLSIIYLSGLNYADMIKGASFIASNCAYHLRNSLVIGLRDFGFRVDGLGRCLNTRNITEGHIISCVCSLFTYTSSCLLTHT